MNKTKQCANFGLAIKEETDIEDDNNEHWAQGHCLEEETDIEDDNNEHWAQGHCLDRVDKLPPSRRSSLETGTCSTP